MVSAAPSGRLELCASCLFGLEGPLGNELRHMGMEDVSPENGRVLFRTDAAGLARANIRSRFAERILLLLGEFPARSFDELFEGVRALPLEDWMPRDAAFPVEGWSLDSELRSVPDCQRIIKKAAAVRLGERYALVRMPETGKEYKLRFTLLKNVCRVFLDTSGTALHKRGYRPAHNAAPLRETLAAAIVDISGYRGRGEFSDPFCGSGTIAIEAALSAKGRAPGLNRRFAAEGWGEIPSRVWSDERESARAREFNGEYRIYASDIDPAAAKLARENARRAGVEELIRFSVADARRFVRHTDSGVIVTNPPYGERLMERRSAEELLRSFGEAWRNEGSWRLSLLTSDENAEGLIGCRAGKRRKLYNGMIKCSLYMFRERNK